MFDHVNLLSSLSCSSSSSIEDMLRDAVNFVFKDLILLFTVAIMQVSLGQELVASE
jgi:hypothetical protein